MSRETPAGAGRGWAAGRRGALAWGMYAALVVASHLAQMRGEERESVPSGVETLALPLVTDRGLFPGESQEIALRSWRRSAGAGERPGVLLLHGSPGSGANFELLAPLLATEGYDVLAP